MESLPCIHTGELVKEGDKVVQPLRCPSCLVDTMEIAPPRPVPIVEAIADLPRPPILGCAALRLLLQSVIAGDSPGAIATMLTASSS